MCGITGFLRPSGLLANSAQILRGMTDQIQRRGPDDEGQWLDAQCGIALGQRRLSIIDLSPAGHQPMVSADGRYVVVTNGEIYNFRRLRRQIEDEGPMPEWRGTSDTEVLLEAIARWGIETALLRATGMFAFALWDRRLGTLSLARDRMGEKPLYYGWQGEGEDRTFLFGSELAAIRRHPGFNAPIDRGALQLLVRHNYIPAPRSIFSGIHKVMPGQWITIRPGADYPEHHVYWDMLAIAGESAGTFRGTQEDAVEELEQLLTESIGRQMIADVPLGAFLSGGIDSSTIVALMQKQSARRVRTFTIGFDDRGFDEAVHAKAIAEYLGTEHTELYVKPGDALEVIPDLPAYFSEPFADSSQIPTFLVSKLARTDVTVSLSGDAGDELFGGYNRYAYTQRYWKLISTVPSPLRKLAARALLAVPPSAWSRIAAALGQPEQGALGHKVHKGASLLNHGTIAELYLGLISHHADPSAFLLGTDSPDTFADRNMKAISALPSIEWMMALDSVHYLPDDILTKVDRSAMAVSLEARVPMLDPDLVRFAWSLPLNFKIRDGQSKWPLRQVLYRHVPRHLVERPKMGFGIPIAAWLRGPLKDWADALLTPSEMAQDGYFNVPAVTNLWHDHLNGRMDNGYKLWTILMFQAWKRAGS